MSVSRLPAPLTLLALMASLPASAQQPRDPHPDVTYAAVVIGINSYRNMPEEVELDRARSDASTVAMALQKSFDYVEPLFDRSASRENIVELLREKVAQEVGPKDVLLVYFVGHGIGSDIGVPSLLAYDSTLEGFNEDGFEVEAFARDIATWTRAGTTILVTDAIHKNQLDGIPFFGPSADQWPGIAPGTMVISSTLANVAAQDGTFGPVFADAMAGAADANADGAISAGELTEYLKTRLSTQSQTPGFAGAYPEDMVVAQGVTPGATAIEKTPLDEATLYGEHEVASAKFVFRDGATPTVQCRDEKPVVCDATCYVRNFKAGPCRLKAIVDGVTVEGVTLAWWPGKYECGLRGESDLGCIAPR